MNMENDKKTGPRDVFSHLLAIIFLYVNIFAFGSVVFSFIDLYIPDALQGYGSSTQDGLRWPLAVLVVVFPCYIWLARYLSKDVERNPEKLDLKTRKWLLYFTLFATTIAIVIDLVSLIFGFLNGELTSSFVLKALTIFAIAASVFAYYLCEIRGGVSESKHNGMRAFVMSAIGIVFLTVVVGFYLAGSPQSERLNRFDDERIMHMTSIQYQIIEYWRVKGVLPATLEYLIDDISMVVLPKDPTTLQSYDYRVVSGNVFELCAVFQTSSDQPNAQYGDSFIHGVGRTCFERKIDPDRFPTLKSAK